MIDEEVEPSDRETDDEDEDDPAPLPQPLIQLLEVAPNRFDPVVDEPVTGAGNDDLWERPEPGPG